MANQQIGDFISFKSTSDLSALTNYGLAVKLDSSAQVVLATAASDKIIGILQNTPKANETAVVLSRSASGVGKAQAGGTIAIGDYLTADSTSRLVATTTAGQEVVGIATEAAVVGQTFGFLLSNSRY